MIKDRSYAGHLLATRLEKFKDTDGVVLAVPRGGVPVAYPVAKHLGFPLEIILTKKIGHPNHPEFAIGAVSLSDRVLDEYQDIPATYIEEETNRLRSELKIKKELYSGKRKPVDLKNKTVILIDDGIATGKTILLTVKILRAQQPKAIILAVPVLPYDRVRDLAKYVDELVYILAPHDFGSVGQQYENFDQVSDEEVILLLNNVLKEKSDTL